MKRKAFKIKLNKKPAQVLGGLPVRERVINILQRKSKAFLMQSGRKPCLAIVQLGDREESNRYIRQKKMFGETIGVSTEHIKFSEIKSQKNLQKRLLTKIKSLNEDLKVDGIIVQFPLPEGIEEDDVVKIIDPRKDVDGIGAMSPHTPATARGVLAMLDFYGVKLEGKKVVVVGRSKLVGLPIALACLKRNATVTICHGQTKKLSEETRRADVLVVAVGHPKLIGPALVSPHQTVIDVGITAVPDKVSSSGFRLVGDVDADKVAHIVKALSPVPRGVGPMTVASLFLNLLDACEISSCEKQPLSKK
ncbi:MAG: bifunctional 5,10-methylenetetrahydrofolate dehydrogenase/5,10-methenyltetrahydrofolate cyclohydrolase [Candidatus Pacebacteria bacterium]|nr:bifunctional 5,10-methylenetetrahydrofolate dehydrogenase/5,10-methenyltetrahydrofolate cyclohydrolase [Candidatus Paceibacterota bacterium]